MDGRVINQLVSPDTARQRPPVPIRAYRDGPGLWRIFLAFLPPAVNTAYYNLRGRRVLTAEARKVKQDIALGATMCRFTPRLDRTYEVGMHFTFPSWSFDVDAPSKLCLDAIFGARYDTRVTSLTLTKRVVKGQEATEIRIREERVGDGALVNRFVMTDGSTERE